MSSISMYAQRLCDAHYQSGKGPDLARIVVSSEKDQKDDEGLENDDFVAVQEVCPCKGLF